MAGGPTAVARRVLLDTGPLVALVNARDPDHERCLGVWSTLRARIVTVKGVLVEATHLVSAARGGPEAALGLVLDAGAQIRPTDAERLARAAARMTQYHDAPMDLVDALLVATAEAEGIDEVLTLDRRGFETYRFSGERRFRLLPATSPDRVTRRRARRGRPWSGP